MSDKAVTTRRYNCGKPTSLNETYLYDSPGRKENFLGVAYFCEDCMIPELDGTDAPGPKGG